MNRMNLLLKLAILIVIIEAFLGFANQCSGQKVEVTLKDKRTFTAEVKAFSYDQLYFTDDSKVFYNQVSVVNFVTFSSGDDRLIKKLVENKVVFTGSVPDSYKNYNETPHPGDKKIILVCSDSLDNLYKRLGKHIAMKGYAIESSSRDFLTIKTALRPTSRWNISYFLSVVIETNSAIITAEWKVNNSTLAGTRETGLIDWEFTNDKKSGLSMTAQSIIYNDILDVFSDFDKVKVKYQ